jgi:hypothetical protein
MIKIVLVLLLFFLFVYVSRQKEGLKNYDPLVEGTNIYGVNLVKGHEDHIYRRLTNPDDPLYKPKFKYDYHRSDIITDMKYFNNATYLMMSYQSFV